MSLLPTLDPVPVHLAIIKTVPRPHRILNPPRFAVSVVRASRDFLDHIPAARVAPGREAQMAAFIEEIVAMGLRHESTAQ